MKRILSDKSFLEMQAELNKTPTNPKRIESFNIENNAVAGVSIARQTAFFLPV
jgi:hypothetical protein